MAVIMGAFGAHGLRGRVAPELLAAFKTGAEYHLIHAVAVLALAFYGQTRGVTIDLPATLMCLGITLFSGSLYLMVLTDVRAFAYATPVGGLTLIAAWLSLAFLKH